MDNDVVNNFRSYREKMNEKILGADNKIMKRIFNLDRNTFADGSIPARVKEMLGLVSSMVLRCDDCVKYHLDRCFEHDMSTEEIFEIFAIANLVGGTIVIPHTRRALEYWEALKRVG
jgi:AhpD family alkylhydroperoxidase